ncbi:MAG TPA: DUF4258 domain-containing protein [Methylomirabilota bacterium]|jgi:hypothetical protein|nr:DUF4258 domain-containing protein [Methylomirabilota bacterium]
MYPRILQQIQAFVRRGDYVLSIHVENELDNDECTEQDLEAAILNGEIVRRERDAIGRPKYIIERMALDGRGLTAVAQPFSTRQLVVMVTVYET